MPRRSFTAENLDRSNYKKAFTTMIHLEDETEGVEISPFNQRNCELSEVNPLLIYSFALKVCMKYI